jgi:light-regulated signal transduction histidine kinase (bacteriophytochrome)
MVQSHYASFIEKTLVFHMKNTDGIEKLKSDCSALEEQVKLLVKTEIKLRRAQAELIRSKEQIEKYNRMLEQKVEERTAQLNQANKDLESFAYSVSHDLRAPLRHIDGFMRLMKENIKPMEPKVQEYFDKISTSSKGMSVMIDELLKFSRLGRTELHFKTVDLFAVVSNIIEQFKPDYEKRNIHWKNNVQSLVKGDPVLLKVIFENLISNAIKYTSREKIAEIEIGEKTIDKKLVCIFVRDNGVGFDMTYKDKLFGVFQRLHKHEDFEGIGIGLANVKQLVTKHGGTINVESELNKGTTFYINLLKSNN